MQMRTRPWRLAAVALAGLLFAACPAEEGGDAQEDGDGPSLLTQITDRGSVACGVNDQLAGFGTRSEEGEFTGFDVDLCRAVAAGVTGDAANVEFKPLTAEQRFTALQSREIDVLIRNTTWTATRDGAEGAAFAHTTFYDGQGMMVRSDSAYQSLEDMNNTTVCVTSGTTTELNLASAFEARSLTFEARSFRDIETIQQNFIENRCDGWTSDRSQLASIRSAWPADQGGPEALRLLPETFSKEPLGPAVRDGDQDWFDAVNWIVAAVIQAEEFGLTQANVDQMRTETDDPEIQRFLGVPTAEGQEAFDAGLSLPADFAHKVIKAVGNYGEIYERHLGPGTPLALERGLNRLWSDGGLLYAPPYR
jgi:general L-amino acid transport system substrate-binding protein